MSQSEVAPIEFARWSIIHLVEAVAARMPEPAIRGAVRATCIAVGWDPGARAFVEIACKDARADIQSGAVSMVDLVRMVGGDDCVLRDTSIAVPEDHAEWFQREVFARLGGPIFREQGIDLVRWSAFGFVHLVASERDIVSWVQRLRSGGEDPWETFRALSVATATGIALTFKMIPPWIDDPDDLEHLRAALDGGNATSALRERQLREAGLGAFINLTDRQIEIMLRECEKFDVYSPFDLTPAQAKLVLARSRADPNWESDPCDQP